MKKQIDLQYSGIIEERGIALANQHCFNYSLPIEMTDSKYLVIAEYKDYITTFCFYYDGNRQESILISAECSCPHNVDVCKHIIGAFYDYVDNVFEDELNYKVGRGDSNNPVFNEPSFVELLIGNTIYEQLESTTSNKYEIIPEFIEEGDTLGIKLKIGIIGGKSFVVKNIYKLPDLFNEKRETIYGQNTEISHDLHQFEGKEFIRTILGYISTAATTISGVSANESRDWYGYYHSAEVKYDKKVLSLTSEQTIQLFTLLVDSKVKYSKYDLRTSQFIIEKCQDRWEFDLNPIDENSLELNLNSKFNRLISADKKMVTISHNTKEIKIYEYPDEKIRFIISNLISNKIVVDKSTAFNFEHSVLSRIDQFITIKGDLSYLYNDVMIYELETTLILQGEQLHVDSRLVDENG